VGAPLKVRLVCLELVDELGVLGEEAALYLAQRLPLIVVKHGPPPPRGGSHDRYFVAPAAVLS